MENFEEIKPAAITENFIKLIGSDWMLVTAGQREHFNTMTASWGGVGFLWNKPVVFVFIRPQRYTFGFIEQEPMFTLSFFTEAYRSALQLCGTKSGRDTDKVAETGLTPMATEKGNIFFKEAQCVLECKKLYTDDLRSEHFLDKSLAEQWYPAKDYHKMYVAEIVNAWEKK